jgi:hypothetical protein
MITIDQNELENMEYLKYLRGMITNDARCTRDIKSRIALAKAAFKKQKTLHQPIEFKFNEETSEMLQLEDHGFGLY